MNNLLLAAVVALLCMQTLHGTPVKDGYNGKDEKSTTTRTSSSSTSTGGVTYTSSSSSSSQSGGSSSGGSTSWEYSSGGTSSSGGSSSGGSSSGGSSSGGSSSGGSSSGGSSSGGSSSGGHGSGGGYGSGSSGGGYGSGSTGGDGHGSGSTGGDGHGSGSTGGDGHGSGSTGGDSDSSDGGCGCSGTQYNFEDIEDLFNSEEINTKTISIQQYREGDCEKQLSRLNNDNDNLTKQLKNANRALATLTEEKSWVLGELEECRDEYNCMSNDFIIITTDNKLWKKKYTAATDEITRLKTVLITANSEGLAWKTKAENWYIELTKITNINIIQTTTINEYSITINNLRNQINEYTIQINNCGSESGEWKRKYEIEVNRSTKYQETIKSLEATISELTDRNTKLNGDLSSCQVTVQENNEEISQLNVIISTLTINLSTKTSEYEICDLSLQSAKSELSAEHLDDLEYEIKNQRLEFELGECNVRATQFETDYAAEKERSANCNNQITIIRQESETRYAQYEEKILQITLNFNVKLEKCESDLTIERNTIININIDITNLRTEIIEITNKWNIAIQISSEWEKKSQYCESNSVILSETIINLKQTITTTNNQLEECTANSSELQVNLSACQGDLSTCNTDLSGSQDNANNLSNIIVELKGTIVQLEGSNAECNGNLSGLRCSVNKFLSVIDLNETKANQAILDIKALFDQSKAVLGQFINNNNIVCETCGSDGPCITDGNGSGVVVY